MDTILFNMDLEPEYITPDLYYSGDGALCIIVKEDLKYAKPSSIPN